MDDDTSLRGTLYDYLGDTEKIKNVCTLLMELGIECANEH
jgi:hypothetical protein